MLPSLQLTECCDREGPHSQAAPSVLLRHCFPSREGQRSPPDVLVKPATSEGQPVKRMGL